MRAAQMQVCPAFRNAEVAAAAAAFSKSASSKTRSGALPPSSRETFFTVSAAPAMSILPTAVDPVNAIFFTSGDLSMVRPMAGASPITTLSTPGGMPARFASSASANAERGVSSDGFRTTVHPTAKAGATFLVTMLMGKFHGVIAPTTPTGCFRTTFLRFLMGGSNTSPRTRLASSADHVIEPMPLLISALASDIGLPFSEVRMAARCSRFSWMRSCHLQSTAARSCAVLFFQVLNASLADAMASTVSLAPIFATCCTVSPVAGLSTDKVAPSVASFHSPWM
mmetsp:Transcript_4385/g.15565  ORF Transcript_4385/g.15565 Transcript_4385/m.15565 type:complete len:282 (+) Transcript_4385:1315-2160(+)